jgi:hypothetical protein
MAIFYDVCCTKILLRRKYSEGAVETSLPVVLNNIPKAFYNFIHIIKAKDTFVKLQVTSTLLLCSNTTSVFATDPYVFGCPGSGSFHQKAKKLEKP